MRMRIYGLTDPSGEIRYVGKTTYPKITYRLNIAIAVAKSRPKGLVGPWIAELLSQGFKPGIVLLEETDDENAESRWIAKLRADGKDLLNLCTGGPGTPGVPKTDECRNKIRAALTGRPLSEERKAKISKTLIGNTNRRGK